MKKLTLKDSKRRYNDKILISDINEAITYLKNKCDLAQENFIIIGIDTRNSLIFSKVLFKGGITECNIDTVLIYKNVFINNCNRFIIGHNHPSGELEPSKNDIMINNIIKKQTKILGIELLDNIIFDKDNYISIIDK